MDKVRTGILLFAAVMFLHVPLQAAAEDGMEAPPPGSGEELAETEASGEGALSPLGTEDSGDTALLERSWEKTGVFSGFGEEDGRRVLLAACIAGTVVVVLTAVLVIRKKTDRDVLPGQAETTDDGIPLKLEVYAGRCRNKTPFLRLSDCLTIGSSEDCDIVFDNPEVAARNSCIRLVDSQVYIEDLDSPQGTSLDGMRFRGRNKLRGGEVISIGKVEFGISFLQEDRQA